MGKWLIDFSKSHWGTLTAAILAAILGVLAERYSGLATILGPLTSQP